MKDLFFPIQDIAQTFLDFWAVKLLVALVRAVIGFCLPTGAAQTAAVCAGSLICLDFLTALVAVARTPELRIESAKMRRSFSKIVAYGSLVAIVAILSRNIPGLAGASDEKNGVLGFTVTGVLGWVMLTESLSILENITRAGILLPPGLREWLQRIIGSKEKTFNQSQMEDSDESK